MNNNLKNYSEEPDPEVWKKLEKTMRRKVLRRQAATGSVGAAIMVLSIVGVLNWPSAPVEVEAQKPVKVAMLALSNTSTVPTESVVNAENRSTEAVEKTAPATQAEELDVQTVQPIFVPIKEIMEVKAATPTAAEPTPKTVAAAERVAVEPTQIENKPARHVDEPAAVETQPAKPAVKSPSVTTVPDTILWIPNIFAPASGEADMATFRARLNHPDASVSNFRMTIFNRNGHQVFQSQDINTAWDGTYRGRALPQAAYVYVIYYTDKDGFQHQRKGTVTLVR